MYDVTNYEVINLSWPVATTHVLLRRAIRLRYEARFGFADRPVPW